jgi:hypothetical protein
MEGIELAWINVLPLAGGSQPEIILCSEAHSVKSGETFGCPNWGEFWCIVNRARDVSKLSINEQDKSLCSCPPPTIKNYLIHNGILCSHEEEWNVTFRR